MRGVCSVECDGGTEPCADLVLDPLLRIHVVLLELLQPQLSVLDDVGRPLRQYPPPNIFFQSRSLPFLPLTVLCSDVRCDTISSSGGLASVDVSTAA